MAVYTINSTDSNKAVRFLESRVITDTATITIVKAIKVPDWATMLSLYIFIDSQTGNTPISQLSLLVPDFGSAALLGAPTDVNVALLADFPAFTAVTGAGPYLQTIDIGPGVTGIADDSTGNATADARGAVNTLLPPWLVYSIALDGTTGDEDYTFRLVAQFRR